MLAIDTRRDPSKAGKNPETLKPSINEAANPNKAALITSVKRPNVRILIGKVNNIRTGRTTKFSNPNITDAITAI